MIRRGVLIGVAIVAGIAAFCLLPPAWLANLAKFVAICCASSAIIARIDTKTNPHSNPVASVALSVLNLPEQPLAKVTDGWALSIFLVSAAFLVSLSLSILLLSNA